MADRAALITGASSGIGLAVARALGERGYGLTMAARRAEKLKHAAEELEAGSVDLHTFPANLTSEDDIVAMVAAHSERFGRLDVLVNNAGVGIGGPVEGYATKMLDLQLQVNLRGVYLTTREAIPMLKQAGTEHRQALIVNISSIAGKFGQGWLAAYSATKAGVVALTQALLKELAADGVKASAICPGFVDTPMTDWIKEGVPADQMIRPEDVAKAVGFLLDLSPVCVVPELMMVRPGEGL